MRVNGLALIGISDSSSTRPLRPPSFLLLSFLARILPCHDLYRSVRNRDFDIEPVACQSTRDFVQAEDVGRLSSKLFEEKLKVRGRSIGNNLHPKVDRSAESSERALRSA